MQIYNFDTAWRTGPMASDRRQLSVFAGPTPSVDQVWSAWQQVQGHGDVAQAAVDTDHPGAAREAIGQCAQVEPWPDLGLRPQSGSQPDAARNMAPVSR